MRGTTLLVGIAIAAVGCGKSESDPDAMVVVFPPDAADGVIDAGEPGAPDGAPDIDANPQADIDAAIEPIIDAAVAPTIDAAVPPAIDAAVVIADAAPPDAAAPDAEPPMPCPAVGDYVEAHEATNDLFELGTTAEATGRSIGPAGASFSIGGCVSPAESTVDFADADFYEITVSADMRARLRLQWGTATVPDHTIAFFDPATGRAVAAEAGADGDVLLAAASLATGTWWIAVAVDNPSPATIYPYLLTVSEYPYTCTTLGGAATFNEPNEAISGHRGNDVVEIRYPDPTSVVLSPTPSLTDSPAVSGVTAAAGMSYRFDGTSANVVSPGDNYRDRDSFQFVTASTATEIHVRLEWLDINMADLDVFLIPASDLTTFIGASAGVGTTADEEVVTAIDPSTTYLLWVGTFDDPALTEVLPANYQLTLCLH